MRVTMSDVSLDFDPIHAADGDELRRAVQEFMDENFDAARFSVSMEAVHVEFPHPDDGEPALEAAFFEHEGVPSRNTTATVRLGDAPERVEIMAGEELWTELKVRWARAEPFNEAVESGIRDRLGL